AAGGWALLGSGAATDQLPLGLPWLQWHVRLDPLAGFFSVLLGALVGAVSLYAPRYTREFARGEGRAAFVPMGVATAMFVVGMQVLLLADDAFGFMVFWELMSVGGYLLVAHQHQHSANRQAAFLFLLLAHV